MRSYVAAVASVIAAQVRRNPQPRPEIIGETNVPGGFIDVLQRTAGTEPGIATAAINFELVTVRILNNALCALLPPRPYPCLSLLRQANLILLRILGLGLSRCWSLWTGIGGILRHEPGYREKDQKKKRIHLASKTLAMMHEPESLHCLPPLGDENTV